MSWTETRERGSLLGMRFVVATLRTFGLLPARIVVEFVVLYFFLTGASARRASLDYLRRVAARERGRAALGDRPGLLTSWRHFRTFGQMLLDRVAFWIGRGDAFRVSDPTRERMRAVEATGRGVMFIGAHVGSFDVLRKLSAGKGQKVRMLMFGGSPMMSRVMRELDPELDASAIRFEEGSIDAVLRLKSEIDAGRWIALLGDRAELTDSRRVARVPFLGAPAPFPQGFLHMAAVLGCPVYFIACLRTGPDAYEVVVELIAEKVEVSRRTRDADLARWTAAYAARVEECCLRAPLQWFNFYDFWASRSPAGEEQHADPN